MPFLTNLLSGVYGYVAIAILAFGLGASGTFYIKNKADGERYSQLENKQLKQEIDSASNAFKNLQRNIESANIASSNTDKSIHTLTNEIGDLKAGILNVSKQKPLPFDCKPDTDRLHILSAAIDSANKASAPSR